MSDASAVDPAFRRLCRDLVRRRLAGLEFIVRAEIVLLGGLIGGFLFWRARVPLDGLRRAHGAGAVASALAGILALVVAAAAAAVARRHAHQLRTALPGPAWLALPIAPARIVEHLAWEARLLAGWGASLTPGLLLAAVGLIPGWMIAAITASFAAALWAASHAATRIVGRIALSGWRRESRTSDRTLDLVCEARQARARTGLRAARWSRSPAWRALWRKDLRLALRPTPARVRLVAPLAFGAAASVMWWLPLPPPAAHAFAFGMALLAAAALAEFLIALGGADPLPVLHSLPLGAASVWTSRATWVALGAGLIAGGQAISGARVLEPPALGVFLVWLVCAAVAIALLGVHYGMTLGSNTAAAQRFLTLTLSISMAASLMIPLLGWIVLLTAVIHSARRVPQWSRIEAER